MSKISDNKRSTFGGSIGFVLAAAGSAVGLGNIWRFPYLAAKDGGGLFLVVYLILAVTFGFTLLTTEVAIGRKTHQSPLTAYGILSKKWKNLGIVACIVPMMILPYYCVIGGWVTKYMVTYILGNGINAANDGYFTSFITNQTESIIYSIIFLLLTCYIVFRGVNKGIEFSSKILMPILILFIIGIAIFSLTMEHSGDEGVVRTGLDGLKVLVIPDFESITPKKIIITMMDCMGQLFYSLSVAMGIMISYGSYVKREANLVKCINRIEIFDTIVAFLAGVMIIPAVYVFMGRDGMQASGPGLMFVTIPKVFNKMGNVGNFAGAVFFVMTFFAALTSAVSILEAVVSSFIDGLKISRRRATIYESIPALILAVIVCLGYNQFYFELPLPNGITAQILDIMDYISNNFLMPVVAICTCVIVGWIVKPKIIIDEITRNSEHFGRERLYVVMVKYISPVMLIILLLKSLGIF